MLDMQTASDYMPDNSELSAAHAGRNLLVLAIGNLLMTDEGAGIHVLNYLIGRNDQDPSIEYMDGGTWSFSIAAHIENADQLIVIDAAELHAPPGTVRVFTGDEMIGQLGSCKLSVHEVGLIDLMDMVRLNDRMPAQHALIGIQPLTIADWNDQPSEPVAAAIPKAAAEVNRLIREWRHVN
jgi:hydrogenase maturation protease